MDLFNLVATHWVPTQLADPPLLSDVLVMLWCYVQTLEKTKINTNIKLIISETEVQIYM